VSGSKSFNPRAGNSDKGTPLNHNQSDLRRLHPSTQPRLQNDAQDFKQRSGDEENGRAPALLLSERGWRPEKCKLLIEHCQLNPFYSPCSTFSLSLSLSFFLFQMWTKLTDTVFSPAGIASIGIATFATWVFWNQIVQIYPPIGTYPATGTSIAPKGKDTK
jgi:hypothetical protein